MMRRTLNNVRQFSSLVDELTSKQVIGVMGSQWGDEGKGKLVDVLGEQYNITARCGGGANAGHTVVVDGKSFAFHLLPSSILHKGNTCLIGNGVVLSLPAYFEELQNLKEQGIDYEGRIIISDRAHLVFDLHQQVDGAQEQSAGKGAIGTTKRGIGPAYASKANRNGIRVGDLAYPEVFRAKMHRLVEYHKGIMPTLEADADAIVEEYLGYYETVKPTVVDGVHYVANALKEGKKIMVEGANATMLDIDFGTYPFVTSSNCSIGGACTGLGIPPQKIGTVIGVVKAYQTRVGGGPMPTEDTTEEVGQRMQTVGREWGVTTGRKRRCGHLDLFALKYSTAINGFDAFNVTKLDVLSGFPELKVCVGYTVNGKALDSFPGSLELLAQVEPVYKHMPGWDEDITKVRKFSELPKAAQDYVDLIEQVTGVPVAWTGVGPGREGMVTKH